MEESVKRRERLKAMRMEASESEVSNNVESSSGPDCLSNPLIETSASLPDRYLSGTPRFDYYTDPLAAFSGNKKRRNMADTQEYPLQPSNNGSPMMQVSPSNQGAQNPSMTPPDHQFHNTCSPSQRMYPAQGPPYNPRPPGTPTTVAGPWNPTMILPPAHQFHSNYAPGQRTYTAQAPPYNSGPQGMPTAMHNPFTIHQPNSFPSNPPRGGPGFGQMGRPSFNSGQGRGYWSNQSPRHGGNPGASSGRGWDHQLAGRGTNPAGPGRIGGRGLSYTARAGGAERLYHKSMVEDPWKFCQPVQWKSLNTRAGCSRTSDSPKPISTDAARVSEASNKSRPGLSLAASLAASLYETINDGDNDKPSK